MNNPLTAGALFASMGIEDAPDGTVKFMSWTCDPEAETYGNNGRERLSLYDSGDGEPIAVATVNIPEEWCDDDEVFIKDYSENEGMVTALMNAQHIKEPHRLVRSGFVAVPVCRLTKYGKALWEPREETG